MKNYNFITKIKAIDDKQYGINEEGVINTKATILDKLLKSLRVV